MVEVPSTRAGGEEANELEVDTSVEAVGGGGKGVTDEGEFGGEDSGVGEEN